MPDIRDVLDGAAPEVAALDPEPIGRRARRRRMIPRVIVAAGVLAAIAVGTVVVGSGDDEQNRITTGSSPEPTSTASASTTTTAHTTTTPPPPTVVAPVATVPLGDDRLSSESRLGYAGLGPIKLGMAFDDAVAAGRVTVQSDPTCGVVLYAEPGSGVERILVWGGPVIDAIDVYDPGIRTISGIAIGAARADVVSTYPSAASNGTSLKIVGPEGNVIVFAFGEDDRVVSMHLSLPLDDQVLEDRARC